MGNIESITASKINQNQRGNEKLKKRRRGNEKRLN
jgi:hypothetical protein